MQHDSDWFMTNRSVNCVKITCICAERSEATQNIILYAKSISGLDVCDIWALKIEKLCKS